MLEEDYELLTPQQKITFNNLNQEGKKMYYTHKKTIFG